MLLSLAALALLYCVQLNCILCILALDVDDPFRRTQCGLTVSAWKSLCFVLLSCIVCRVAFGTSVKTRRLI